MNESAAFDHSAMLHDNAELRASTQSHVDEMNEHFARVEQIKKFKTLSRNLTPEDGELAPTLKVKHNRVQEHFAAEIDSLYSN